jgi:hypothetical protein
MHTRRGLPPRPCIRCYAKDTDTFFFIFGDAEWTAGVLSAVVDLSVDEALGTVEVMRREHGTKPDVRHPAHIRLCAACMARSKVNTTLYTAAQLEQVERKGGELQGFVQTDEHTRRALER